MEYNFKNYPCVLTSEGWNLTPFHGDVHSSASVHLTPIETQLLLSDGAKILNNAFNNMFIASVPIENLRHYSNGTYSSMTSNNSGGIGGHHGFIKASDDVQTVAIIHLALEKIYGNVYTYLSGVFLQKFQAIYMDWNKREELIYNNINTMIEFYIQQEKDVEIGITIEKAIKIINRILREKDTIVNNKSLRDSYLDKVLDLWEDLLEKTEILLQELKNIKFPTEYTYLPGEFKPNDSSINYPRIIRLFAMSRKAISVYIYLTLMEFLLSGVYLDEDAVKNRLNSISEEILSPFENEESRLLTHLKKGREQLEKYCMTDLYGNPLRNPDGSFVKVIEVNYIDMLLNDKILPIKTTQTFSLLKDVTNSLQGIGLLPSFEQTSANGEISS